MTLLLLYNGAQTGGGPPPVVSGLTGRQLGIYDMRVSWDDYIRGLFTVGYSTLGSTDSISGSSFDEGFEGAYDLVPRLERIQIRRGRSDDLSAMQEGRISFVCRDPEGVFNVRNPSSPILANLRPMRPVRFRVGYDGVDYDRFRGYLRRVGWEPAGRGGYATFEASDFYCRMGGEAVKPTIEETATTTGGAIGLVLDQLELRDPAFRSLDTGDVISSFSADGTRTALQIVEELLTAERGVFFANRAGVVTYLDRHSRNPESPAGAITSTMRALDSGTSIDDVIVKQRVTKTGGAEHVAFDLAAMRLYDLREGAPITNPYIFDENAASSLASYIVSRGKTPTQRLWSVTLDNRDGPTFRQMLLRDIGDRVTITEARNGSSADFIVEGITEDVDFRTGRHTVAWLVSLADTARPFRIGSSLIGSTDEIVF